MYRFEMEPNIYIGIDMMRGRHFSIGTEQNISCLFLLPEADPFSLLSTADHSYFHECIPVVQFHKTCQSQYLFSPTHGQINCITVSR